VLALPLAGERFDCGSRHGFIRATMEYAMDDDEIREPMLQHMLEILTRTGRV
jgi:UTP-glucose-1-phosphate uridylyltransferase